MVEKRRHKRYSAPTVSLRVGSDERTRSRHIEDISAGGVFIRTGKVSPIGTRLVVKLKPPGWERSLSVAGKVVRIVNEERDGTSMPCGMGVEFVDVSVEQQTMLAALLEEYAERAPSPADDTPTDPEALRREVEALRTRLQEATDQVTAAHTELEKFEQHQEANRELVARLFAENERLRAAHQEEVVKGAAQLEAAAVAFHKRLGKALEQAKASHKEELAEQTAAAQELLDEELEELRFVERLNAKEAATRLEKESREANARARDLHAAFERSQQEFEASVATEQQQTMELLDSLAAEQNRRAQADERIRTLETRVRQLEELLAAGAPAADGKAAPPGRTRAVRP